MQETQQEPQVRFLGQENPLKKQMATPYSILAWKIPWTAHGVKRKLDGTHIC